MSPRVQSELLLVGSLPAASTEEALREGSEFFGDLVFALPDGETGPRAAWVGYERERLMKPNPGLEMVAATESPTGIPRHAYETPIFKVRSDAEVRWDAWPRIDDAIESYRTFRALREDGVIPARPAVPDRVAVSVQRAECVQGRLRRRLRGRRASVRGPRAP